MNDQFESPKILLDRARERLNDLSKTISNFVGSSPYLHVVEPDSDGMIAYKFRITASVPKSAMADAFEIGNALRAALDQAVYAATLSIAGGAPTSTKFPFGDTEEDVENDIKRGCKDVPAVIVGVLRAFKPHQKGNVALWGLNKMRNVKIHRALLGVRARPIGNSLQVPFMMINGPAEIGMSRWNEEKQELTYMRLGANTGSTGYHTAQAQIGVVIEDIPAFHGQPANVVFENLFKEVERVVGTIEAVVQRETDGQAKPSLT
ncbi:MAG: hypothetical protein GC166_04850 [Alphaproteobacteria bacterium]|nr:hypothetical protein [Alphaproteobacteria bacterium]